MRFSFTHTIRYSAILGFALYATIAAAQTLPSGVINVPPTTVGNSQSIGSDTTLNVLAGGSVGRSFQVGLPSTTSVNAIVNVDGGSIDDFLTIHDGGVMSIISGQAGSITVRDGAELNLLDGSTSRVTVFDGGVFNLRGGQPAVIQASISGNAEINVFGGSIGDTRLLSAMNFFGGEFRKNGASVPDGPLTLGPADLFSATLEDGTVIAHRGSGAMTTITLTESITPPLDLNPIIVDTPTPMPRGLRPGQTLIVQQGGELGSQFDRLNMVDATMNVTGGVAAGQYYAYETEVNISGGDFAPTSNLSLAAGSTGNLSAGTAHISVTGAGSTLNVTGGKLGFGFFADSGSEVNIHGGQIGNRFQNSGESQVTLFGGEFELNGGPVTSGTVSVDPGDVLTGTLEDGSPVIFWGTSFGDRLRDVRIENRSLPTINTQPMTVDSESALTGLRSGESLTLVDGGVLDSDFSAVGATLNIQGGVVGPGFESANSHLNISAGSLAVLNSVAGDTITMSGGTVSTLNLGNGSEMRVSGGMIGFGSDTNQGSRLTISGGSVGGFFDANDGSVVNILGGMIAEEFGANNGSVVNILGGQFATAFASSGSEVNVYGGEFEELIALSNGEVNVFGADDSQFLAARIGSDIHLQGTAFFDNGVPITGLTPGEKLFVTADRNDLSGILADGTAFTFDGLFSSFFGAALSITLVDPIDLTLPGDYNADGFVDAADYSVWRDNLGAPNGTLPNDPNSTVIGVDQYSTWKSNFGTTFESAFPSMSQAVPEPNTLFLLIGTMALGLSQQVSRVRCADRRVKH